MMMIVPLVSCQNIIDDFGFCPHNLFSKMYLLKIVYAKFERLGPKAPVNQELFIEIETHRYFK